MESERIRNELLRGCLMRTLKSELKRLLVIEISLIKTGGYSLFTCNELRWSLQKIVPEEYADSIVEYYWKHLVCLGLQDTSYTLSNRILADDRDYKKKSDLLFTFIDSKLDDDLDIISEV